MLLIVGVVVAVVTALVVVRPQLPPIDPPIELLTGRAWLRRLVANRYIARAIEAVPPLRRRMQRRRARDEEMLRDLAERMQPLGPHE